MTQTNQIGLDRRSVLDTITESLEGELTIKPVMFQERGLVINYDTSFVGSEKVEIQDARGKPVHLYSALLDADLYSQRFSKDV